MSWPIPMPVARPMDLHAVFECSACLERFKQEGHKVLAIGKCDTHGATAFTRLGPKSVRYLGVPCDTCTASFTVEILENGEAGRVMQG